MESGPSEVYPALMRLRIEILAYLGRGEGDLDFCSRIELTFRV
jgi:hypothetical protein